MQYKFKFSIFYILLIPLFIVFSCNETNRATIYKNGMVSSAHPIASKIGIDILKKGGNAFDAAIAVHFALSVVYPNAGNIGGGGFLVYRLDNGEVGTLDFREKAPNSSSADMYLDDKGNVIPGLSSIGGLAVGVPGTISAIFEIHNKFGSLPIEELFKPSIELAQKGFLVTEYLEEELNEKRDLFIKVNGESSLYSKEYQYGDTITNNNYARTLLKIMNEGKDGFYSGEVAEDMIETISIDR